MGVTARQLGVRHLGWSNSACTVHNSEDLGKNGQRKRSVWIVVFSRNKFISECKSLGIPINPTMDGFFYGWNTMSQEKNSEKCTDKDVYLVPLQGGIRIGLCAIRRTNISSCRGFAYALG